MPRGRRGHSALVHRGAMLLYGGYRDLRGSSNELWAFHFGKDMEYIYFKLGKTQVRHIIENLFYPFRMYCRNPDSYSW